MRAERYRASRWKSPTENRFSESLDMESRVNHHIRIN